MTGVARGVPPPRAAPAQGTCTLAWTARATASGSQARPSNSSSDARLTENRSLTVRVKPHPTSSPDQIRALLPQGRFPERWQFVTGDFHDVLEASNVLIGNASSVCLEALAKGVPVIVIAPRTGIVQNVIPSVSVEMP